MESTPENNLVKNVKPQVPNQLWDVFVTQVVAGEEPHVQQIPSALSYNKTLKRLDKDIGIPGYAAAELRRTGVCEFERGDAQIRIEIRRFGALPQTDPAMHGKLMIKLMDGSEVDWYAIPMSDREELLFRMPRLIDMMLESGDEKALPAQWRDIKARAEAMAKQTETQLE